MDVKEYALELAKTAQLDEETQKGLIKALENPKFAEEFGKGVKRQSDYSRGMDEVRSEKQKWETEKKSYLEWYDNALKVDTAREEELQRYRGGAASTVTATPAVVNTGVSKKDLENAQSNLVSIMKQAMKISSSHAAQFKEALDTDLLEKIAVEKGLTLDRAYDEMIRPRIEESREKDFAEKLRLAREEGVREGLSKKDLPGEGEKAPFHPIFGYSKAVAATKEMTGQQKVSSFEEAWNSAGNKK